MYTTVDKLKKKFGSIKQNCIEEHIQNLPSSQQEAARNWFATAIIKNPHNRRYSMAWIYDCILLRIKSRTTYEHMRKTNLLPPPCVDKISRYLRQIKGRYGFQDRVFQILKLKSQTLTK